MGRKRTTVEKQAYAEQLKKNPTKSELEVLRFLYRIRSAIPKYEPQKVLCGWIVDFLFPSENVVLEIDGSVHNTKDQKIKDRIRADSLEGYGFKVFRVKNKDIMRKGPRLALSKVLDHFRRFGYIKRASCTHCGKTIGRIDPLITDYGIFCSTRCNTKNTAGYGVDRPPRKKEMKHPARAAPPEALQD